MSLGLYRQITTGTYTEYLEYNSMEDILPIITTQDGELGEIVEKKIYVRNDDATQYYTNIRVTPVSKVTPSEVDGVSTGHGIKLYAGSSQPTEAEWDTVDYANTITISDLGTSGSGDTTSYLPFWLRIESPAGTPISNRENTTLVVYFRANAV